MKQLPFDYNNRAKTSKKGLLIVSPFDEQQLTKKLFKKAVEGISGNDFSHILYIGPTAEKLELARRDFSSVIPFNAYIAPKFFTIKQFAKDLHERFTEREIIPEYLIPLIISRLKDGMSLGYAQCVADLMKDVRNYLPDSSREELRKLLNREFEGYEDLRDKSEEALRIIELYINTLREKNLADDEEVLATAPSLLEADFLPPKLLILDGFYDLTRLEERILRILIKKSDAVFATAFYDGRYPDRYDIPKEFLNLMRDTGCFEEEEVRDIQPERSDIELLAFSSAEEEVEGIAREIKRQSLEGHISLDDTIVTFSRIADYAPSVRRIFLKYGIPHTMYLQSPLRISPPVVAVLELLRAVNDDFPRLSTSIVLSSPCYPRISNETKRWAPYYAKRASIIKGKSVWHRLARSLKESGQIERKEWLLISKVQKGIEVFMSQLAGLKRDATLSGHINGLREILTRLGFDTNRGFDHHSLEAKNKFLGILSAIEYMESRFGQTICNLSHFLKTIDYLASRIKCPVEKKPEGVKVMGLLETRGIDAQDIFFGGLIEGRFPGHPKHDPILPENTKINMGLPNIDRYLKRQRLHYFRLCNSSINKPHLSYPTTEGDRLLLASPFFEGEIIPATLGEQILSREEEMRVWGRGENISPTFEGIDFSGDSEIKDCLRKRFGPRTYISVTGLERYRHCPYLFYLENVLDLRIEHEPTYEIEAKIWGTLIHKLLAFLYQDGFVPIENIKERILACTEKALSEERLPKFWEEVARKIFRNITGQFIAHERDLRTEGLYPIKVEYLLKGKVAPELQLKGRIDRVDGRDGIMRIIDYKTGRIAVTQAMMERGISIQLPLYAKLLELDEPGLMVDRVAIYSLRDMKVQWFPKGGSKMKHLMDASLGAAKSAAESIRSGVFNPQPAFEKLCGRCPCRSTCSLVLNRAYSQREL